MKALILGCGYVGLAVGRELARLGHEVVGLRRTPAQVSPESVSGFRLLAGDLTRPEDLRQLPGPFDWIVNTVSSGRGGPDEYQAVYLDGMRHLVAWLRQSPSPPRKLVYTSSTGVYGQEDGSWVDETSPTEPASSTSQILLAAERVLLDAARDNALPAVILRLGGIYGPGRGYWFKQYLNGQVVLADQGQRISNMIHRDDASGAVIAALQRGKPGTIYNVVDNEPVTLLDFFQWLSVQLARPLPPLADAFAAPTAKRAQTNKRISNARLQADLGYALQYPTFREGYASEIQRAAESQNPKSDPPAAGPSPGSV